MYRALSINPLSSISPAVGKCELCLYPAQQALCIAKHMGIKLVRGPCVHKFVRPQAGRRWTAISQQVHPFPCLCWCELVYSYRLSEFSLLMSVGAALNSAFA